MRLFGLIGYPLSHSFSKKYFTEKFEKEGLTDCSYQLFPITSVDEIREIIDGNPGLAGLNVTVPYKQLVLKHLDSIENIPTEVMACNCIKIKDGKLSGYNTDIAGFNESFLSLLKSHHKRALILGNGGAAAAVKYVLRKSGIDFEIVSRKIHDASSLTYKDLNEKKIRDNLIIINTTPLGMSPNENQAPDIPYEYLTPQHFLFDLIYNPGKTLFLQKGEKKGAQIKNGFEMLVSQAEESWRIWND